MNKWLLLCVLFFITALAQAEPLPAEDVFKVQVKPVDPNAFVIDWEIKPHYFLYRDRISITETEDSNAHLGTIIFPKTTNKTDKQGRIFKIYRNHLALPISILGERPGETLLKLNFQGCSDEGFCYPPEQRLIKVAINDQLALSQVALENNDVPSETLSNTQNINPIFSEHHWVVVLLLFYGFGLLLAFTPCILPMVPVLSGIIVGHGKDVSTKKAFFLSLSYVLSMSVTYAIVGAVIALLGANIQISMQSPWAISIFSLIFIVLALSMFGFYEFKLPQAWQNKIAGSSRTQRGGHYLGAAVMGVLSTLILSPCVTAPLIGVLTYIAKSGDIIMGSVTLFILSLGMGTPLLVIGTSAGKWLPAAGNWMNAIKALFGILFLAVAIQLLSRIVPGSLSMALWSFLLIFSGIYAGALTYSSTHWEKLCQGIGIILLGYGLLILIGCSMGNTNPLQPLTSAGATTTAKIPSLKNQSLSTIQAAINHAAGSPVLLDFYADWCTSCKVMEETIFKNPKVLQALSHFDLIKIDITDNTPANREIMRHFKIIAPPTYLFFNAHGQELNAQRVVGEIDAQAFLDVIRSVNNQDKISL